MHKLFISKWSNPVLSSGLQRCVVVSVEVTIRWSIGPVWGASASSIGLPRCFDHWQFALCSHSPITAIIYPMSQISTIRKKSSKKRVVILKAIHQFAWLICITCRLVLRRSDGWLQLTCCAVDLVSCQFSWWTTLTHFTDHIQISQLESWTIPYNISGM